MDPDEVEVDLLLSFGVSENYPTSPVHKHPYIRNYRTIRHTLFSEYCLGDIDRVDSEHYLPDYRLDWFLEVIWLQTYYYLTTPDSRPDTLF